jgi:Calx-beta domain-containing protein
MPASAINTGAPRRIRYVAASLAAALSALQLVAAAPAGASGGTFGVDSPTRSEPGDVGYAQMVFNVTRTFTSPGLATVDYQTVAETGAGKATAGQDYVAASGTVVFDANESTKQVMVDLLGDSLNEGDETFTLRFLNPSGEALPATPYDVTGTITDDNDPAPSLSVADASAQEGDTGSSPAGFVVTLSAPSGRTVTVDYATADGTAAAPADYTAKTGTLTFNPGQLSKIVPVSVIGDSVDEADESFSLNLSGAVNAGIASGSATGLIVDDDGQPSVSVNDVVTADEKGKATFKVTLSNSSGRAVSVQATAAGGTATAGSDFEPTSKRVDFPPGVTSQDFEVPLLDDNRDEPAETFSVLLSAPQNALLGDGAGAGTITDDDAGPGLSIDDITEAEGEGPLPKNFRFTVRLDGAAVGQVVTVKYAVKDGTATAPVDYLITPSQGTLTFLNSNPQTITVAVNDDSLAEGTETFTVELSEAVNAVINKGVGVGTIVNDDGPPAIVSINDVSVAENLGPALFTVSLSAPVTQAVVVSYATKDGSAAGGRDYTPSSGTVTFAPNDVAPKTISVPVTNEDLNEADEAFTVELSNPVNAVFNDASGAATITNDDPLPTLSVQSLSVDEGNNDVVAVTLSAESGREVRVSYAPADGTAVDGLDYSADPDTTLVFHPGTFGPGETRKLISVRTNGDSLYEGNETFTLGISAPQNATIPLGQETGVVTITDDDPAPLVTIDDARATEPAGGSGQTSDMSFAIHLSAPSGKPVQVKYRTVNDIASAPNDFDKINTTPLTIPAGASGSAVVVKILGDALDEPAPDETFQVELSNPVDAAFPDSAPTLTATGSIEDNDGSPLLSVVGTSVGEGAGTASVAVKLLPASPSSVTVHYASASGSAQAPADFTAVDGTLSFDAGQTVKVISVPVTGDQADEVDETFTVALDSATGAAVSPTAQTASVTIVDDDGPSVSVADISVAEGDSGSKVATFVVSLSAPSPEAVSVDYATVNGTARSPGDYTRATGTVSFAANDPSTSKSVTVNVAGDTLDEGDEDFTLTLSNPVKAAIGRGAAMATIVDDDQPAVSVSVASGPPDTLVPGPKVKEGDLGSIPVTFTLTLSAPTEREASLDYATVDGTARGGADYLAAAGRISFVPGETTKSVVVTVVGDSRNERDETFSLRLSEPRNLKSVADTVATILDDDTAGYALVASDGGIFAFGGAEFAGSTGDIKLNQPIVGMASTPSGRGYWMVATDGGIFSFGDARFFGSTGNIKLNKPIVGMAATPTGKGYWLVASDGGVFSFGDAKFFGSTGAIKLNKPIVGMSSTPTGQGYWMVATDGGIFAFGDAKFLGSTGAIKLNQPIVGMATTDTGKGYWLVATDGGIFTFGDAKFFGSTGALKLNKPIVGMTATGTGAGYWMVATDGGIFSFGDAKFLGSTGATKLNKPIVGMVEL